MKLLSGVFVTLCWLCLSIEEAVSQTTTIDIDNSPCPVVIVGSDEATAANGDCTFITNNIVIQRGEDGRNTSAPQRAGANDDSDSGRIDLTPRQLERPSERHGISVQ